jgi:hypothetical protein
MRERRVPARQRFAHLLGGFSLDREHGSSAGHRDDDAIVWGSRQLMMALDLQLSPNRHHIFARVDHLMARATGWKRAHYHTNR